MRRTILTLLCLVFFCSTVRAGLSEGDAFYKEGSYGLAAAEFADVLKVQLTDPVRREVRFKWADSVLKSGDTAQREEAVKQLKELVESEEDDRWRAEAQESLAGHYIQHDRWSQPNNIKIYLEAARDYWAGSTDLELARPRFIDLSFTLGEFVTGYWGWSHGEVAPVRHGRKGIAPPAPSGQGLILLYEEVLKVAASDEQKARAHYSLGMAYAQNYAIEAKLKDRAVKHFQTVIDDFPATEWADDAHFALGQYFESQNDFVEALKHYRALLEHFQKGESRWINDAERRVEDITGASLSVHASYVFLPGSEVRFHLSWKNVTQARVAFYPLTLTEAMVFDAAKKEADSDYGVDDYSDMIKRLVEGGGYASLPGALSFDVGLKEEKKHWPGSKEQGLAEWRRADDEETLNPEEGILPAGAYLLLVTAGDVKAYELVIVSDMALVSKTAESSNLFFVFDGKTGAPVEGAQIKYHYRYYDETGNWRWAEGSGVSDASGLLNVALEKAHYRHYGNHHSVFAVAVKEDRQVFVQSQYYTYQPAGKGAWWLYAFSDRPAYRPNEEIAFKGILRGYEEGRFSNPAAKVVGFRIYDNRNTKVKEGTATLNAYGAFHDALTLDEKAVLGEYRIEIWDEGMRNHLAGAPLFRLEEYKLPEFVVTIQPRAKDGESAAGYRPGEDVSVDVAAEYYFGGPVANAEVEYLVYQSAYHHHYEPPRPYPWYYDDMRPQTYYYGGEQLIQTEKIKTDERGKATFTFATPENLQTDLQYRVEARVVDQSRREIRATSNVKVTRNAFYAFLEPKQKLYRPGDRAEINIRTLTANDEPVAIEGKVTIARNWWTHPVLTREGDGVEKAVAEKAGIEGPASPAVAQDGHYSEDVLLTKFVKTDDNGAAVFTFDPERDGYYVVTFTGYDAAGAEVTSQTQVFVCAKESKDIGYQYGGLQIITESDTYTVGDTAAVMLVADRPGTWVLLTTEIDEILDYRMVRMDGAVKLLDVPIKENYTPNVFLTAVSGDHYQLKTHTVPLIIPPEKKFLNVKIISDKAVYSPQEEGHFGIFVTDQDGRPVSAEIALGITDASVYYIQDEYAPDIRKFFYGDKRLPSVQTQASFYQRRYQDFGRNEEGQLAPLDLRSSGLREKKGADLGAAVGGKADGSLMVSEESVKKSVDQMNARSNVPSSPVVRQEMGDFKEQDAALSGSGSLAEAELRTDFRSTVIWQPSVITDENGHAEMTVTFPDSLTTWRATARAVTGDTTVGNVTHEVKSRKELMVRLQAPRFFTERDLAVVSALIDNVSDEPLTVTPSLEAEGVVVTGLYQDGQFVKGEIGPLEVPAGGQTRVDWAVSAQQAGTARLTVTARSEKYADAMVKSYPVIPHGIEKFIAEALVIKGDGVEEEKELTFVIPKERIKESTQLRLTVSPSLAANLLDALPYLADYPYGCVEQTMSRFLPAVIVAKTMRDLGISDADIQAHISDVLAPRGDPQHPDRRADTTHANLEPMIREGLDRLYDFQHADGGWGWWKEGDSDRFMTAYVVWGMGLARDAGVDVKDDVLQRGIQFLQVQLVEEEDQPDMLAWMLNALAQVRSSGAFEEKQRERLWKMRDELNPYTRAVFALSEHLRGNTERAQILARNAVNGIEEDKANGTAHWGESGVHYRFSEGGVEATALNVKALASIDPSSVHLEPAVKWLALNRRGSRWKNTRDTAIAILGLTDYLKASGELSPDYDYEILVNGTSVRQGHVDQSNMFAFSRIIDVPADALGDDANTVQVRFKGKGALYVSGYLKYFTLEEGITKAGNEVFVERRYFKQSTEETLLKGYAEGWTPLKDGDTVQSGDRVRVEIILEAKNHYEYLVAEDYKPAGLEAVELKSGVIFAEELDAKGRETNKQVWAYQEFRDQKVAFFITKLPQGKWRLRYELRAEAPGQFHAMPDQTHAMYVPEIRANSDEMRLNVRD